MGDFSGGIIAEIRNWDLGSRRRKEKFSRVQQLLTS